MPDVTAAVSVASGVPVEYGPEYRETVTAPPLELVVPPSTGRTAPTVEPAVGEVILTTGGVAPPLMTSVTVRTDTPFDCCVSSHPRKSSRTALLTGR